MPAGLEQVLCYVLSHLAARLSPSQELAVLTYTRGAWASRRTPTMATLPMQLKEP